MLEHQTSVSWRVRVGHFLSPSEGYSPCSGFVARRSVCAKWGVAHFPSVHIPLSLPLIKKQSWREFNLVFAMISLSLCLSFPPPSTPFIFSFWKREMLSFIIYFLPSPLEMPHLRRSCCQGPQQVSPDWAGFRQRKSPTLLSLKRFNQLCFQGICAQMSTMQLIFLTFCTNHHWNLSVCSAKSCLDPRSYHSYLKSAFNSTRKVYTLWLIIVWTTGQYNSNKCVFFVCLMSTTALSLGKQ